MSPRQQPHRYGSKNFRSHVDKARTWDLPRHSHLRSRGVPCGQRILRLRDLMMHIQGCHQQAEAEELDTSCRWCTTWKSDDYGCQCSLHEVIAMNNADDPYAPPGDEQDLPPLPMHASPRRRQGILEDFLNDTSWLQPLKTPHKLLALPGRALKDHWRRLAAWWHLPPWQLTPLTLAPHAWDNKMQIHRWAPWLGWGLQQTSRNLDENAWDRWSATEWFLRVCWGTGGVDRPAAVPSSS